LIVRDAANLAPATVVFNASGMLLIGGDLDPGSGADFTRAVGSGSNEIRWNGGGGFGAIGGDRVVNLFGDGQELVWNTVIGAHSNKLFLSHSDADATIELANGLGLTGNNGTRRTITVTDGSAEIDAVISGVIANAVSGTNVGLNIEGGGTLKLTGANTYGNGTELFGATLEVSSLSNIGNSYLAVKRGATFRYTGTGSETLAKALWVNDGSSGVFDIVEPTAVLTFDPPQGNRTKQLVKRGAGTMVLTKAITQAGSVLVEDGILELTASNNNYTGSSQISGGTLAVGAAGVVTSSLVQIDSAGSFDVTAKAAGYEIPATQTLSGSGTVVGSLVLGGGATLSPGASPGTLSVSQDATFDAGGNYNWQVLDAAPGGAGQAGGWDLLSVGGELAITATSASPFAVNLWSLSATGPDQSGLATNFDPSQPGTWTFVTAAGGITGFSADAFLVNTSASNGTDGFANDPAGGSFAVLQSGNSLNLVFSPVPEPSAALLVLTTGLAAPQLWSPDSPTLYDLAIPLGEDRVESYVGIREVGRIEDADGHWRFTLNGRPIFHFGPLDQGWWPDGLLTPPSDAAMRWDVDYLKAAGFNMIRQLDTHPSIVVWVPFNEAWGQHQTMEVGEWTVARDPSRLVNVASGGNFWPVGHIVDEHRYPHPGFPFELDRGRFAGLIKVVGEFGGHGLPVPGHLWGSRSRRSSSGSCMSRSSNEAADSLRNIRESRCPSGGATRAVRATRAAIWYPTKKEIRAVEGLRPAARYPAVEKES